MRKVSLLLLATVLLIQVANAQSTRRILRWRASNYNTASYTISNTTGFTSATNWRVVDPVTGAVTATTAAPASFDTLQIFDCNLSLSFDYDMTALENIVIDLGAPRSGQTYTFRVSENNQWLLHSTAQINVRAGGVLRVRRDNSGGVDTWVKIGGVNKLISTNGGDISVAGPASAHSSTPAATALNTDGGFIMGTLPVVLVAFDAAKQGNGVVLNWKTQQEYNTREFQVEKSTDGRLFTPVATVAAAGNATTPRSYSYTDNSGIKGITYYRIRIIDLDNKSGITAVKAVRATAAAVKLGVYPNPAVSVANIVVSNPESLSFSVNVFNRNGQLVAQRKAAAGTTAVALDVNGLTAGDYLVDVQFSNGSRESAKLIVARQ
jgi:Secretion system C-terminal sorting domain